MPGAPMCYCLFERKHKIRKKRGKGEEISPKVSKSGSPKEAATNVSAKNNLGYLEETRKKSKVRDKFLTNL
jgi:hypothetical protein